MSFAGMPREDITTARNHIILISVIAALILIAVFTGLVVFISRKVAAPLKETADSLEIVAGGDFTEESDTSSMLAETYSLIQSYRVLHGNRVSYCRQCARMAKSKSEPTEP